MSGFDNGTLQGGVFFQAKQLGSILRGFGPPVPQAGIVGDLYIDVQTFNLYTKRSNDTGADVDPWGHYLFVVPNTYQATLKWFGSSQPTNDIGVNGDYYLLWAGYPNYGMQPSIFGPKGASAWPGGGGTVLLSAAGVPMLAAPGSPILTAPGTSAPVPAQVAVTLNPLYTAEDQHSI